MPRFATPSPRIAPAILPSCAGSPRPAGSDMDELVQRGIHLFNSRRFFECHEVWEEVWTPERGPRRLFLQSLIHFAVALHHTQRGNPVGASRQLRKGLRNWLATCPAAKASTLRACMSMA